MSAAFESVLATMAAAALPIRKRRRENGLPTNGSRIAMLLSRGSRRRPGCRRSQPGAAPAPDVAVYDIERPLAGEHAADFARRSGLEAHQCLLAVPRDVRRGDHIFAPSQRVRIGK